ncbi:hypothetical protein OMW55_07255 [Sphingomonas sp. BN140010]|uniref:Uncharacterized protein n=1 Tax=Sphingomonas arvum TaxID=2992113 RepID=A0ABT3JF84_9SPHN|nr:hypothetical protein [Sphingomonas sp. BN140010]MCW3797599.1 hypothetical protein [Sphingomonas sp. BN140010]
MSRLREQNQGPEDDTSIARAPRSARRGRPALISDVFGVLEREGEEPVSIEDMNNAVLDQAAVDDASGSAIFR